MNKLDNRIITWDGREEKFYVNDKGEIVVGDNAVISLPNEDFEFVKLIVGNGCIVRVGDNAVVKAGKNCNIFTGKNCDVTCGNYNKVIVGDDSTVVAHWKAEITAGNNCYVEVHKNSTIDCLDCCNIKLNADINLLIAGKYVKIDNGLFGGIFSLGKSYKLSINEKTKIRIIKENIRPFTKKFSDVLDVLKSGGRIGRRKWNLNSENTQYIKFRKIVSYEDNVVLDENQLVLNDNDKSTLYTLTQEDFLANDWDIVG